MKLSRTLKDNLPKHKGLPCYSINSPPSSAGSRPQRPPQGLPIHVGGEEQLQFHPKREVVRDRNRFPAALPNAFRFEAPAPGRLLHYNVVFWLEGGR